MNGDWRSREAKWPGKKIGKNVIPFSSKKYAINGVEEKEGREWDRGRYEEVGEAVEDGMQTINKYVEEARREEPFYRLQTIRNTISKF